jgi:hypothetical protein
MRGEQEERKYRTEKVETWRNYLARHADEMKKVVSDSVG